MAECVRLTREMLKDPVMIRVAGRRLDFPRAQAASDRVARKLYADPMLLAWFDGRTGQSSPRVDCCREDKPGWLVYAESRGGDLVIDINDEEYVFVYRRL